MARLRGRDQPRARDPARTRTNSISSVAYATEERASEEKTASATTFDKALPTRLDRGQGNADQPPPNKHGP